MEYMVAAALLYGDLKYEMYEESFEGFEKINNLRKKIIVTQEPKFTKNYYELSKRHISNSIEIVYNDKSISEIMTEIENIELPKEYDEDSFEWFGIYDEEKDKLIPYYDFPMLDVKKPMNELNV